MSRQTQLPHVRHDGTAIPAISSAAFKVCIEQHYVIWVSLLGGNLIEPPQRILTVVDRVKRVIKAAALQDGLNQ